MALFPRLHGVQINLLQGYLLKAMLPYDHNCQMSAAILFWSRSCVYNTVYYKIFISIYGINLRNTWCPNKYSTRISHGSGAAR